MFPEINYDKVEQIWGMDVIVATTAKTDEEARMPPASVLSNSQFGQ